MTEPLPKKGTDPLSGGLKAALVIGSLIASVVGARLVAAKDAATAAASSKPAIIIYSKSQAQPAVPNAANSGSSSVLPAIPTVIVPAPMPISPITSTHSSR